MLYWVLDVIVVGAVALFLAFAVYALGVGLLGIASGERFVRCPSCRRFGLTADERLHRDGCPAAGGFSLVHARPHSIHLRHH